MNLFRFGGGERRARIGVLDQHVGAFADHGLGRLLLLARIEPAVDPHYLGVNLRIHGARAERERVDVADHLGDRHRRHHAERVALGRVAGHDAGQIRALVHAHVVDAEVGRFLEAGRVQEGHVRIVARHFQF